MSVVERPTSIVFFCLALVAICYANSLPNDLLGDDHFIVGLNPAIRSISPRHFLSSPFWGKDSDFGIYRPLVVLSFSIEYAIWQLWTPGFRLVNLLLHALNGVLVFMVARSLLKSVPGAWAAAAVYLVHPVHTEAVVGIAGRSELLSATFFFLAWMMFRQNRPILCAVAFLLSLMSKENAICFPAVILLDTWLSRGQRGQTPLAPFFAVAASAMVYLGLRFWILGSVAMPRSAQYLGGRWTLGQRELTSGRAFLKYFQLLLAPVDVTGNYDFDSIPLASPRDWDAWLGILLIVATIVLAFKIARKRPAIAFGILFFYATMLPMSNWILPTGIVLAERYLYVPSFGFALLAGALWAGLTGVRIRRWVAGGALAAAALLCISHNYIWRDDLTFFTNMVRVLPNNAIGRHGYGVALLKVNRIDEARAQFEAGLRVARNTELLVGMAGVLIPTERSCVNAYRLLDEALAMNPRNHFARWTVAECLENDGQVAKAEEAYRRAVHDAQFPDPRLLYDWGRALEKSGRPAEALQAYQRGAAIDPNDSEIQKRLTSLR